jgi:manganese/iron transport system substrate-binding protein
MMKRVDNKKLQALSRIVALCCFALAACNVSTSSGFETGPASESFLSDPQALSAVELAEGEMLRVVATTNIVGDVVSNVGGTFIELTTLLPVHADPHAYEPTPGDLQAVSDAHVVFINGLGLEVFLEEMLKNVGRGGPVVSLSEGIDPLTFGEGFQHEEGSPGEAEEDHDHGTYDPHVWFDPTNVMVWTDRVAQTLSILDPGNSSLYEREAQAYQEQLQDLDEWIFELISQIPPEDRKLVTDHRVFDYFASRYGFDVVGAVIPVYSSAAEPSAQEIVELQLKVRDLGVKTLFVGVTVNPDVVRAVVEDTGIEMISLYTGSLSDPEGPAGTYIDFMKFNVESIVRALQDEDGK